MTILAGSSVDGIGTEASFSSPSSIAQSGTTLYVTDRSWHSLRTVHTTTARVGTIVTNVGGGLVGGYVNGDGTTARFNAPSGIVAADAGTLYVADSNNHRIRKVTIGATAAATQVDDFAGSGTAGHANGTVATAQFNNPTGLAIRGTTLYVADYNNHRIRAIDLTSETVRDIAGDGTAESTNGIGTAARFNKPTGIIAVSENTLYIATEGKRIRKLEYR